MGATLMLTTLGIGAANSRFAPAGRLIRWKSLRVMLDGG